MSAGGHFRHRLPFGAEIEPDGRTRFRLWAPACKQVAVVLRGYGETQMQAEGGGWFRASLHAPAGSRYRYRVAPDLAVPDPAARAQDGDVHGWSVVVDPFGYRWRHALWRGRPWHEAVVYETHAGAHAGGFAGLAADLPRLAALGITALELMPVADFPGTRNWGYDGVLPFAPDESYGGPEALKALVDTAHGLGLMVLLDVVYNHFGPDGNWLGTYAPGFFAAGHATPWGDAIDFTRAEVRDFFVENAIYWIEEFRLDGLRLDAVHAIENAPGERLLDELARRVRAAAGPDRLVHLVLENDHNAASHLAAGRYDAQWNDDGHHALHVLLTGETDGYYGDYAEAPAAMLARCLAEGFAYQGEPSPHRAGEPRGEPSAHLPPTAFVLFLQNHDQIGNRALGDRLAASVAPAALAAATALVLLCPQIPMLFMGEEWASRRPFLYFTDHHGALADAVREGRRREFARFAAFADPQARAAIPDPNDPATFSASRLDPAEADAPQQREAARLVRRLLALRHACIVPRLDGARALGAQAIGPAALRASWRLGDGSVLALAANLGPDPLAVPPSRLPPLLAVPETAAAAVAAGTLPGLATLWWLATAEGA